MKPRILFVDDEPNVLVSIRDMLRKHRQRWDMTFCPGGDAAVALLRRERFDVVVCDMRMPRVDGAEVLARALELQPHTVRIVLSGHTNKDASVRAVKVAHRFLNKPFDSAALVTLIDASLSACQDESAARVREFIGAIDHLPSPPSLYFELERLIRADAADIEEVAALVARDPAMVAKLLQVVNSAFFGLPQRITSVHAACTYLGTATISDLVLVAEAFGTVAPEHAGVVEAVQQRGLLAAAIAKGVVADRSTREAAAIACLLHDVGALLLAINAPEACAQIEAATAELGGRLAAEAQTLGFTHVDVGAALTEMWGLPEPIVRAIAAHHGALFGATATAISAWTHVACQIAHNLTDPSRRPLDGVSPRASAILDGVLETEPWRATLASVLPTLQGALE